MAHHKVVDPAPPPHVIVVVFRCVPAFGSKRGKVFIVVIVVFPGEFIVVPIAVIDIRVRSARAEAAVRVRVMGVRSGVVEVVNIHVHVVVVVAGAKGR